MSTKAPTRFFCRWKRVQHIKSFTVFYLLWPLAPMCVHEHVCVRMYTRVCMDQSIEFLMELMGRDRRSVPPRVFYPCL